MSTHDRVRLNTPAALNQQIREETDRRVAALREADPVEIRQRIEAIDREWDVERALGLMSSALSIFGLTRGLRRPRWFVLPLVVQGFYLQHAVQGWCPPLPLLRAMGFRSQQEIERERYTLRALLRDRVDGPVAIRSAEMPARNGDTRDASSSETPTYL